MANDFVLVDSDVVSYIFRKDTRAALYESYLVGNLKAIAIQSFAELSLMPLLNSWSEKRKEKLQDFLRGYIIVEANQRVGIQWAKIQLEAKKKGRPISTADAWIAATALAYSIPLVTHNYDDFKNVSGLTIITENKNP